MQIKVALPSDAVNRHTIDDEVSYHSVLAGVLIPGRVEPLKGAQVVKGSIIERVGPKDEIPSKYSSIRMWDAHVHFEGAHVAVGIYDSLKYFMPGTSTLIGAVIVDNLRQTLMAGFTSVRELCGYAGDIAPAIDSVKSIEHGVYLDEEVAAKMKEKDAILVPTRHIVEAMYAGDDDLDPRQRVKPERTIQLSIDSIKLAVKMGVKVALGTDSFSGDRYHAVSHEDNAMELRYAVETGMTPLQAIEMSTVTPPETLGPQARKSGQLKVGYDADLIAICSNPFEDIEVLIDTDNITRV
ncbi:hypothetical protein SMACR_00954 [Sordaria macrospora]|uniref:WGS project CABT00000000 data, contig 2.2 n=2 Tax=Sordaria macrospora TaxID=5147 RepID=F7VNK1_SORMK|nr:uncharacterized protein SMAC_00954 [Sordaria macrospora k-hell]KAA8632707.1 hypothetical protein SMACR_00954 [Sordaria macrospora]WPJ62198.1 hypothetical protein SMAC4_00954 [Sordaria macrospora]CCC06930.1 unnamed protein product [Sordaria macrospora k-hell]